QKKFQGKEGEPKIDTIRADSVTHIESTYGDVEEINGVEANREGVTNAQFEADEHGGGQSGGLMIGVGNVVAPANGEEESKAVLDGNKTEVWDSDEHGSLVGSNED
ncbi:hypothetical protein Gotur_010483, partial [Gossypium turneri]